MAPCEGFGADTMLNFGSGETIQANGADIEVPGCSVPCFVDWNNDQLKDLIIGEGGYDGGSTFPGKVRVYLNVGTESNPQFSDYFYARSYGSDLTCTASGFMGCFPRVAYWDADARKDLLIGQADGTVRIFLNVGTDAEPEFAGGTFIKVGTYPCCRRDIDVGFRATPIVADWDNDGKKDLIVGAHDGRVHLFLNEGTDTEPFFRTESFAQADGNDLIVPGNRSSPAVLDLDGDRKKDLLTGNTEGLLFFYRNIGAEAAPVFAGPFFVVSGSDPIDLPDSSRSRPYVCYWTNDPYLDVLIGAADGKVHLYQGIPETGDMNADGTVDLSDFILFATYWQQEDRSPRGVADFTADNKVDSHDLRQFAANWLLALD